MDGWRPQPTLRQKRPIDPKLTDAEIFRGLPTGDLWQDADLVACYRYLRSNKKILIPSSWESALDEFDAELAKVACPTTDV